MVLNRSGRAAWPAELFHFTTCSSDRDGRKIKLSIRALDYDTSDDVHQNWVITSKRKM